MNGRCSVKRLLFIHTRKHSKQCLLYFSYKQTQWVINTDQSLCSFRKERAGKYNIFTAPTLCLETIPIFPQQPAGGRKSCQHCRGRGAHRRIQLGICVIENYRSWSPVWLSLQLLKSGRREKRKSQLLAAAGRPMPQWSPTLSMIPFPLLHGPLW